MNNAMNRIAAAMLCALLTLAGAVRAADVTLNGPLTLVADLNFSTPTSHHLQGNGNTLTLNGYNILIGANATLYMIDVDINGVNGTNIRCLDATGTIVLQRVRYGMDGDYAFSIGSLRVASDSEIRGPYTFSFTSADNLDISSFACFRVPWGTTFIYDPVNDGRTNMVFEDRSAELYLDGGTFEAPADGVALTKGTLVIGNSVVIRNYDGATPNTNANKAITLGDGANAANDMRVLTLPGARLQTEGYLHTRNVGP